ncbi:group XIIA secretory phospholipase A2-like isoform X1 [Salmo salar]|uniref:Group XIIA secretory phospholipase A2-like isoform X1 n=1 Tax=Salmo salar TaxID=8030 RepID=A0ABM3F673_SALSA|nr:group XIIA secretory phospholipase A2-like isoform X1 [Salmo salar]
MTLKTIRNGIHNIDKYINKIYNIKKELNVALDLEDMIECVTTNALMFDIGIPSLTKCCNQHDRCYDTCNRDKHDCDNEFQECLETICRRLQKMLGLAQSVQVDIDNPTLTKFCDQHNCCYAICNSDKDDCDDEFQECLERDFCRRLQKMLGLA